MIATTSGYTGGDEPSPSYRQVSAGVTGHAESLQVLYDPKVVSYEELLQVYWHQIDPTVKDRQFCDGGKQYRSAIFYHNESQKEAAYASFEKYRDSGVFGTKAVGHGGKALLSVDTLSQLAMERATSARQAVQVLSLIHI